MKRLVVLGAVAVGIWLAYRVIGRRVASEPALPPFTPAQRAWFDRCWWDVPKDVYFGEVPYGR